MLLKETPDHFYINDKMVSYRRKDAVSFIAFKEGFVVYSTAGVEGSEAPIRAEYGHVALGFAWLLKIKKDSGIDLTEEEEKDWDFYKKHLKIIGTMGSSAKELAHEFLSGNRGPYNYSPTESMLKGRIWRGTGIELEDNVEMPEDPNDEVYKEPLKDKVVSFWSLYSPNEIKPFLGVVSEMIESLGEDPEDFYYEFGNSFYPYSSIAKGSKSKTDFNKKYHVGSSVYTYSDFERLRIEMHTGGPIKGKRAKEILCRIMNKEFIESNPELKGFIPPDCSGVNDDDEQAYKSMKRSGWRDFAGPEVERGLAPTKELLRRKYGGGEAKRQIKSFLQGTGPEPVTSTALEPGNTAGMKGRTLGGFRGRTQKEIDAAWDDFMRKREQTSPEQVSFKEWLSFLESFFFEGLELLKEDPNEVSRNPITGRPKLKAIDSFAVTFILFKDYSVYAPTVKGAFHDDLCRWLAFKVIANSYPGGKEHLTNFEKANPWTGAAREVGRMGPGTIKTIRKVTDELEWTDGRSSLLRVNPEVILGRLWLDHRVVSFWNYWPYVTKASERILQFVSMFDDPSKFEYDIRNMPATYEDIEKKKPVPSSRSVEA
jgi:hypothetical protein